MSGRFFQCPFLCTRNFARSILAEASLPLAKLDAQAIKREVDRIGQRSGKDE